jgi:hypothetical protein
MADSRQVMIRPYYQVPAVPAETLAQVYGARTVDPRVELVALIFDYWHRASPDHPRLVRERVLEAMRGRIDAGNARWRELMPTDGTHLEVVQGMTSAADAVSQKEIEDATALRSAILDREKSLIKLNDKASNQITAPATLNVNIGTDGSSSQP